MHLFIFLALTLAFLCVSVLAQGWDGPIFHIVGNVGNEKYIFNINGAEYENPNLTLIKGQTYQFSIDYINDPAAQVPHPFGFTSTNLTTQATVESFGAIGNIWCKTNFVNAFITTNTSTPCIVNYTANTDAYYQCKFHPHMIGKLTVIDPTNSTSTNGTTPSPTFNGTTFHIIGDRGTDAYIFNVSGVAVENPSFDMVPGQTYQFSIDYLNFPTKGIPHPFGFTTASAGTADVEALGAIGNAKCDTSIPNAFITTDVSKPCIITYVANVNTFYQCAYHPKMRGALTIPSSPTQSPPFNGTTFHIIGDRGTDAYIFNVSGVAVENPSFDLVLGQIYQFSIDYINDPADRIYGKPHPFGFASHAVTAPAVEALGAVGNANCKTTFPNTFITTDVSKPCIITYVANINTFYQCSFHRFMRGALNIIGSTIANSSSSSPTNTTSNNGTTQPTQAPRFTGTTFHIIGDRGRDAYIFNVSGVGVENPSFNLIRGQTYQFSIDYINDPDDKVNGTPHPFGFATPSVRAPAVEALGAIGIANCKTTIPNTFITTDKSKPCIVTYTANVNAFYQCVFHPLMRGALNVIDPVSSSTGGGPTPTSDPRCVAGICINAASSLTTSSSMYLFIIASLIALAVTAF